METTFSGVKRVEYLGVDLTDRYSKSCRAIDVCGLTLDEQSRLRAKFWRWEWSPCQEKLDVSSIVPEIRAAKSTMLDGPQGLASIGKSLRECERLCGAVGKTPDVMPKVGKPFAGFIHSSIELFSVLAQAGFKVSPSGFIGGISEVYPGNIWTRLTNRTNRTLSKKSSNGGRQARKAILQALGVVDLPDLPTHDENDACISAVLAAAADRKVPGICVRGIGLFLEIGQDGIMREGPMVIPEVSEVVERRIEKALNEISIAVDTNTLTSRLSAVDQALIERATALRDCFIEKAREGHAQVCTYAWAYRHLFCLSYSRWSQAYTNQVISVAESTSSRELPGLGMVKLDAFIVAAKTGLPGGGHWESADYDRDDWERVLGTSTLLK